MDTDRGLKRQHEYLAIADLAHAGYLLYGLHGAPGKVMNRTKAVAIRRALSSYFPPEEDELRRNRVVS